MENENLTCEELKEKIIQEIQKINCSNKSDYLQIREIYTKLFLNEEMLPQHKDKFTSNFDSKFSTIERNEAYTYRFCLDTDQFKKILDENQHDFLRVYFVDEKSFNSSAKMKLGLLFRFTNQNYITVANMNITLNEKIYLLNTSTNQLDLKENVSFSQIRADFHNGLGVAIKQKCGINHITESIKYLTEKIDEKKLVDNIIEIDVICLNGVSNSSVNYEKNEDRLGLSFKVNSSPVSYLDAGQLEP